MMVKYCSAFDTRLEAVSCGSAVLAWVVAVWSM